MADYGLGSDNIDMYMSELSAYGRLDRAEEESLARQLHSAETREERMAARDRLICANLRLVVKIAHDFKKFGVGFADLVSEGNVGLMMAVDKFDPDNGAKFSVYAAWWIKQSMRRAIQWQSRVIRMPSGSAQKWINIRKAMERWSIEHGREPSDAELSRLTGYPTGTIRMLRSAVTETVSMNESLSDDSDTTFADVLEAKEDDRDRRERLRSAVASAMSILTEMEHKIVSEVFGLFGPVVDMVVIAKETGLSLKELSERLTAILGRLRIAMTTDPALDDCLCF